MIQTLEICHGYRPYYQFVHAVLFRRNVGDMWLSNVMLVLMLHVIIWSHVCRGIVITENLWRRICKNKIHTLQQQVTTTIINNTQTHTKLTSSLTISISNLPFISCGIGCWQPLSVQSARVEHLWQGTRRHHPQPTFAPIASSNGIFTFCHDKWYSIHPSPLLHACSMLCGYAQLMPKT